MKKLNKKGFTLVELLAVIIILALIMVLTIPTVLGSMGNARKEAFKSAVASVQKYIDEQIDLCEIGSQAITPYDEIFSSGCTLDPSKYDKIIKNAGYEGKMQNLEIVDNKITNAKGLDEFSDINYP